MISMDQKLSKTCVFLMVFLAQLGTMPGFHYFSPTPGIFKVQKRKEKLSISQPFLAFEKFLQVQRYLIIFENNTKDIFEK